MRWSLKPKANPKSVAALATELNVIPLIATLLVQRGIHTFKEAKSFFRPTIAQFHDPFLMKDMDLAVARIQKAIKNGENIMVYGDYDVDGTTSVALLSSYLLTHTPNIATYIPDRYAEGYGVSFKGIDYAHDNDISLIIALDCGIKAIDKVAYANKKNIDFIICDHHRPGSSLPEAVAVLDPKRADCEYPYKELCGCGVGFKLMQAFGSTLNESIKDWEPYLDLVATAIGADIVPITGENRALAYLGLAQINSNPRLGFKAILDALNRPKLTITDVVFVLAPRINAAGRMKHGQYAVNLLTAESEEAATEMAAEIEFFNTDRKGTDKDITQQALDQITENKEEVGFTTVVYQEDWHKGVIGIVASRLIETYYRPTLVFTKSGTKLAASARSVKGFDVYEALEKCAEHIEQFGGHKYAAGLTLSEEQYPLFKKKFEEVVKASIPPHLLEPEIGIDAAIDLIDICPKTFRILKQFAPFGPGNMSPIFMSTQVKDSGYGKAVGEEDKHLKLSVFQEDVYPIGSIGFNLGNKLAITEAKKPFDIAFSIDENHWQGVVSLQLKLQDLKPS